MCIRDSLLGGRNTTNLFLGDYSSSKNIDRELFVYEATSAEDSSLLQVLDYFENVWKSPDSQNYTCSRKTEKISACAVELENRYKKLQELYPESYETWNLSLIHIYIYRGVGTGSLVTGKEQRKYSHQHQEKFFQKMFCPNPFQRPILTFCEM